LDAEIGNFVDCTVGVDLISTGSGIKGDFYLAHLLFSGTGTCIRYGGAAFLHGDFSSIMNCSDDNTGVFLSGFDFTLASARDANVQVVGCAGVEDKNPHAKVNITDNVVTTACSGANTYYKVNGMTSKPRILFDNAATAGTWAITYGGQSATGVAWDASAASIKGAIEALTNVTTVTVVQVTASKEWTFEFVTAGEGWLPLAVDVAGLTTTTAVEVLPSFYVCKVGITNNRLTFQSDKPFDGTAWVSGNLSVDQNNRTVNIGIRKNATGNVYTPFTVRTGPLGQPYPFAISTYLPNMKKNDFYELWVSSGIAGDVVTVQDLYILFDSK